MASKSHFIGALLILTLGCVATVAAERPNVVLILADDVGQECLGCYGGESYATPHLDRLANTGARFRHCYSMPVCHPTRTTLLTGQYPFRHGKVAWGSFAQSAESSTFARLMAESGYATGVFGKWQLALLRDLPDHPYRLGFQHSDVFGWHEGPRYYEPMIYRNGKVRDDTLGHYGPDLYVRGMVEFMKRHREQPFLVFYPMALCHDVTDDLEAPVPHGPLDRYDSYGEMVAEMDRSVGRIVAALEALGLRERTLILFVGDNGTPRRMILRADGQQLVRVPVVSRQRGRDVPGGKGTLKDTGTRVPLLANWPGTIESGQVLDDLVDMSDFWPTLLELARVPLPSRPSPTDGISFAARLRGEHPSPRRWAYSQGRQHRFVRNATWKLYEGGELFNMRQDPSETNAQLPSSDTAREAQVRKDLEAAWAGLGPAWTEESTP